MDGSVGGLGTKDTINSGLQLSGIQIKQKWAKVDDDDDSIQMMEEHVINVEVEETKDQKAMRAILVSTEGGVVQDGPIVDIIPHRPVSETDAYRPDVLDFPDEETFDNYARVPVLPCCVIWDGKKVRQFQAREGST